MLLYLLSVKITPQNLIVRMESLSELLYNKEKLWASLKTPFKPKIVSFSIKVSF
jgi:hypothetical protein